MVRSLSAAITFGLVLPWSGCGSFAPVEPCGRIPDLGCPIGRGGSCEDAACAALYDCVDGAWSQVEECEAFHGEAGGGGAGGTNFGVGGGGGACAGVTIDRSEERDGCTPDLQLPDCHVAAAQTCEPCLTGCEDFFLCTGEGWVAAAFCDLDGEVVVFRAVP
jgi:hypothetical protein